MSPPKLKGDILTLLKGSITTLGLQSPIFILTRAHFADIIAKSI